MSPRPGLRGGHRAAVEMLASARVSHHRTVEARDKPAITSLRLLAVLTVLSEYASLVESKVVKRRAPRTDAPLTHFASPRGAKSGLAGVAAFPKSTHEPSPPREPLE